MKKPIKDRVRISLQYIIPQRLYTRLMGRLGVLKRPRMLKNFLIKIFIKRYGVNISEALEKDYRQYKTFNDFFTRQLAQNLRQIDSASQVIVSPADGIISEKGRINKNILIQAKGYNYTLIDLLGGSEAQAADFENGEFMTIYLSPKDYHRVHMPLQGKFLESTHIRGKLFSVNPLAARMVSNLFARNERVVTLFGTPAGKMAVILVGAMIVGGIVITGNKQGIVEKGAELGYFKVGSTVIILFEAGKISWQKEMQAGLSLKMGEKIGIWPPIDEI